MVALKGAVLRRPGSGGGAGGVMVVLIEGRVMRVTRVGGGWHSVWWSFASDSRSDTREQGCRSWGATVLGCTCGALNCRAGPQTLLKNATLRPALSCEEKCGHQRLTGPIYLNFADDEI